MALREQKTRRVVAGELFTHLTRALVERYGQYINLEIDLLTRAAVEAQEKVTEDEYRDAVDRIMIGIDPHRHGSLLKP